MHRSNDPNKLYSIEMPRKLLKFLILFDNTSLLYFPGQFLSGRVLLELQDDTPALGLHFHVVGEGVVRLRSVTYDKENFIDFRMKLLGDNDQGPSVLSPGIHSFPFKLGLPLGLPSTFLGRYGWIQYYCKAALREPSGLIHKNHQVFIVMSPIDLNLEQSVLAVSICPGNDLLLFVTLAGRVLNKNIFSATLQM